MEITNDLFLHYTRCSKAGFLYLKKDYIHTGNNELLQFQEQDVKQGIVRILENYFGSKENLLVNYVHKHKDGTKAIADFIVKTGNKTSLFGIFCSNNEPNWIQIMNLAYTYHVITATGQQINEVCYIIAKEQCKVMNNMSIEDLKIKACTKKILQLQSQIGKKILNLKDIFRRNATPGNKMDMYCVKPIICPFKNHCEQLEFPEKNSIMELQGISYYSKMLLKWKGILQFNQPFPKHFLVPDNIKNQIAYTERNEILINKKSIRDWTNKASAWKFVWFLDFEYDTSFRPLVNCTETLATYPYLYTLYYKDLKSDTHGSFQDILVSGLNPSSLRQFVEKMVNHFNYTDGYIIVSGIKKAKECLINLSNACPEHEAQLEKLSKRLLDLSTIFVDQYYYDPKFKGSLYLKDIAPIMCPAISYENLKYKSGNDALLGYKIMVHRGQPDLASDLKEYSKMDATSLLQTFEFLQSVSKG